MQILRSITDIFSTVFRFTAILFIYSIGSLFPKESQAQNQPIYNQFFLNPFIYNPAYAGKNPNSMAYLNYRQQWVGIDGAPISYTFMYDTEFKSGLSFGIIAQNDTRGIISTSSGQITIGYGIKFTDSHGLRFGLSAGAGTNSLDLSDDFTDAAIQNALDNNFFLLGRVGLNYYYKDLNLSFSIPDLFKRQLLSTSDLSPIEVDPLSNYMIMASGKVNLVPKTLVFNPHVLYRATEDGTNYIEAVGVFDIKELVWIGGSYRQNYGVTGLAGIKVKNYITIGYGYEIPTSQLSGISNATHEIQLSIRLGKDKIKEAQDKIAALEAKKEKQRKAKEAKQATLKREQDRKATQEKREQLEKEAQEHAEAEEIRKRQRAKEEATRTEEERLKREAQEQVEKPTNKEEQILEDPIDKEITELALPEKEQKTIVLKKGNSKDELQEDHYVIVGSLESKERAEKFTRQLNQQGYQADYGYSSERKRYYVHLFKSSSAEEARTERDKYRKTAKFKDAWHLEVQVNDISDIDNSEEKSIPEDPIADDHSPIVVKRGNHVLELKKGHYVVIGAFSNFKNAEKFSDRVLIMGHQNSFGYSSEKQLYYIYTHQSNSANETRSRRNQLRKIRDFKDAWYLLVED